MINQVQPQLGEPIAELDNAGVERVAGRRGSLSGEIALVVFDRPDEHAGIAREVLEDI